MSLFTDAKAKAKMTGAASGQTSTGTHVVVNDIEWAFITGRKHNRFFVTAFVETDEYSGEHEFEILIKHHSSQEEIDAGSSVTVYGWKPTGNSDFASMVLPMK